MIVENLTPRKIATLCECLASSESKRIDLIGERYARRESDFADVLEAFRRLRLVSVSNDIVTLKESFELWLNRTKRSQFNDLTVRAFFAGKILKAASELSSDILEFFGHFENVGGQLVFSPSNEKRLHFAGIRNLFAGLGVIEISADGRRYAVAASLQDSIRLLLIPAPISPAKLAHLLEKQELAGQVAEDFILRLEKKRLLIHPELVAQISHTSKINASAGYDIESFHGPDCPAEPGRQRYIEVKAVSQHTYEFYWTRNEMAAAQRLTADYCLYLVPMLASQKCEAKGVLIIQDPHAHFAGAGDQWRQTCEVLRVRRD